MSQKILITGPTRSGKSEWAERLATRSGKQVLYIATAQVDPSDADWQARIDRHQQRRPSDWLTLQVPVDLVNALGQASDTQCLLIDSLGTWLTNCLEQDDAMWDETTQSFLDALQLVSSTVILVAEETGWGVVPAYPIGRTFRDRLGLLTRQVGAMVDEAYLVTAGYALNLKKLGISIDSLP